MTELPLPRTACVRLDAPPVLAAIGIGVHGPAGHVDVFELPDLWQFHLYDYEADLTLGGVEHAIRPGSVSLAPPGTPVRYRYRGRSEHLYVHLRLGAAGEPREVVTVQPARVQVAAVDRQLRQALAAWPNTPGRAVAEVWAALWRVAELDPPRDRTAQAGHPAVFAAVALIDHTVIGYIRARRMAQARHLLRASTLSLPAVAATVGIPDLQAFNKACRRELGASPRAIRARVTRE